MFDPPTLLPAFNGLARRDLRTAKSTALNRKAAASGMVLLRNAAPVATPRAHAEEAAVRPEAPAPLLPLSLGAYLGVPGSILVAGATADDGNNTLGNYACDFGNCSTNVTSILGGLRNAQTGLDATAAGSAEVVYVTARHPMLKVFGCFMRGFL